MASLAHIVLALSACAAAVSPIELFALRVQALRHDGNGPFCLGAIDTLALEASFKTAATHEPFDVLDRPTIVASTPGSGAEWLVGHLRRAETRAHVTLSEYPFHEHAAQPRRLDNETNVIYVLRNPFSAYRVYRQSLDAMGARVHPDERATSIDDYVDRWWHSAVYWTSKHDARLVHYEHLLVDPLRALSGVTTLAGRLEIGEHETPAQHFNDEPPRLTKDARCGRALVGYASDDARRLADKFDMARFGYSLFESPRPFSVRVAAASKS